MEAKSIAPGAEFNAPNWWTKWDPYTECWNCNHRGVGYDPDVQTWYCPHCMAVAPPAETPTLFDKQATNHPPGEVCPRCGAAGTSIMPREPGNLKDKMGSVPEGEAVDLFGAPSCPYCGSSMSDHTLSAGFGDTKAGWMCRNNECAHWRPKDNDPKWTEIREPRHRAKTAAQTTQQRLNQAQELEAQGFPDCADITHQYDDGWTVRCLNTLGDMYREGELMGNCFSPHNGGPHGGSHPVWEGIDPIDAKQWSNHPLPLEEQEMVSPYYSLRDADNLPHVSVDFHQWEQPALGIHNSEVKPEYWNRLHEWSPDQFERVDEFGEPHEGWERQWSAAKIADAWEERQPIPGQMTIGESPQTYYHYAPSQVRDQIAQQGLRPADDLGLSDKFERGGDSQYVWLDERGPDFDRGPDQDIWRVDPQGLEMEYDPGDGEEPWWRTGPIPPERLRRISASIPEGQAIDLFGRPSCPQCASDDVVSTKGSLLSDPGWSCVNCGHWWLNRVGDAEPRTHLHHTVDFPKTSRAYSPSDSPIKPPKPPASPHARIAALPVRCPTDDVPLEYRPVTPLMLKVYPHLEDRPMVCPWCGARFPNSAPTLFDNVKQGTDCTEVRLSSTPPISPTVCPMDNTPLLPFGPNGDSLRCPLCYATWLNTAPSLFPADVLYRKQGNDTVNEIYGYQCPIGHLISPTDMRNPIRPPFCWECMKSYPRDQVVQAPTLALDAAERAMDKRGAQDQAIDLWGRPTCPHCGSANVRDTNPLVANKTQVVMMCDDCKRGWAEGKRTAQKAEDLLGGPMELGDRSSQGNGTPFPTERKSPWNGTPPSTEGESLKESLWEPASVTASVPHILGWEPNNHGKGWLHPDGHIQTWVTSDYGEPHHGEMLDDYDEYSDTEYPYDSARDQGAMPFEITPTGQIFEDAGDEQAIEEILKADPRLKRPGGYMASVKKGPALDRTAAEAPEGQLYCPHGHMVLPMLSPGYDGQYWCDHCGRGYDKKELGHAPMLWTPHDSGSHIGAFKPQTVYTDPNGHQVVEGAPGLGLASCVVCGRTWDLNECLVGGAKPIPGIKTGASEPWIAPEGTYGWHAGNPEDHESIMQNGLYANPPGQMDQPAGVYMYDSEDPRGEEIGYDWRKYYNLYRVNVSGLPLQTDELANNAFIHPGDIGPERIELASRADPEDDTPLPWDRLGSYIDGTDWRASSEDSPYPSGYNPVHTAGDVAPGSYVCPEGHVARPTQLFSFEGEYPQPMPPCYQCRKHYYHPDYNLTRPIPGMDERWTRDAPSLFDVGRTSSEDTSYTPEQAVQEAKGFMGSEGNRWDGQMDVGPYRVVYERWGRDCPSLYEGEGHLYDNWGQLESSEREALYQRELEQRRPTMERHFGPMVHSEWDFDDDAAPHFDSMGWTVHERQEDPKGWLEHTGSIQKHAYGTCPICGRNYWGESCPSCSRGSRTAMAMRPEDLNAWIEQNGPHMYHHTDPANIDSILEHGILPQYRTDGSPKDHVYLSESYNPWSGPAKVRVDLRKLDPAKINVDPDSYFQKSWSGDQPSRGTGVPGWPQGEISDGFFEDGTTPEDHYLPSNPAETWKQLQEFPSIAYEGHVPPEALEHVDEHTGAIQDQAIDLWGTPTCPFCGSNNSLDVGPGYPDWGQFYITCNDCGRTFSRDTTEKEMREYEQQHEAAAEPQGTQVLPHGPCPNCGSTDLFYVPAESYKVPPGRNNPDRFPMEFDYALPGHWECEDCDFHWNDPWEKVGSIPQSLYNYEPYYFGPCGHPVRNPRSDETTYWPWTCDRCHKDYDDEEITEAPRMFGQFGEPYTSAVEPPEGETLSLLGKVCPSCGNPSTPTDPKNMNPDWEWWKCDQCDYSWPEIRPWKNEQEVWEAYRDELGDPEVPWEDVRDWEMEHNDPHRAPEHPHWSAMYTPKQAMAERSGNPKLDALIEEFLQISDLKEMGIASGFNNWINERSVEQFRQPSVADGSCEILANTFTQFLKERGVEASSSDPMDRPQNYYPETDNYVDYNPYADTHCVTFVDIDGERYMVDWTAAQFDLTEDFPMVQRMGPDNTWQRHWSYTWTAATEPEPWEPGSYGKGYYHPELGSRLWKVDSSYDGMPWHAHVLRDDGIDWVHAPGIVQFNINPKGAVKIHSVPVDWGERPPTEEETQAVYGLHPALGPEGQDSGIPPEGYGHAQNIIDRNKQSFSFGEPSKNPDWSLVPPCPKCGGQMDFRDTASLGPLYPEGAWQCYNCFNVFPLGEIAPDAPSDQTEDAPGDMTFPEEWTANLKIKKTASKGRLRVYTAYSGRTPIGYVQAWLDGPEARIAHIWVAPPYRGHGIGKRLLSTVAKTGVSLASMIQTEEGRHLVESYKRAGGDFKVIASASHQLNWQPGQEGKGFVLSNGSVWTWPTLQMRPRHMDKSKRVKGMGLQVAPASAFHITPAGEVYTHGPDRYISDENKQTIATADPNLNVPGAMANIPKNDYGHAQGILDTLNLQVARVLAKIRPNHSQDKKGE